MSTECFHCGLPVLEGSRWQTLILGEERSFCCAGCEAVAQTIAGAGLADYYATRTARAISARDRRAPPPAEDYDDPAAQRQFVARTGEHEREAVLILGNIRCAACVWLCERTLRALPGVTRADLNATTRHAVLAWDERRVRASQIIHALRDIGYDASPCDPQRQDLSEQVADRRALWRLFVAGFGAMQVMMYAFPAYLDAGAGTLSADAGQLMRWASLLLTLPVVAFSCGPFFEGALRELRQKRIGLDAPIALGIAGGFAASAWAVLSGEGPVYFDSLSMLAFLLLAARYVEHGARRKAARMLDLLQRWMPDFALRLSDPAHWSGANRIAAHALVAGDLALVPAGARIPADGEVFSGISSTDESLLTGESRPVRKERGAQLVAGSVNLEQPLVMRVARAGAQTRAAAIARLVARAGASRPQLVEAADQLASKLTMLVLLVAAGAALYWTGESLERAAWIAVAVLVASCPCALALAAPIVLTRVQGELLRLGAAFTRERAIEAFSRASDVVFDKTGTLTSGRLSIARIQALGRLDADACLALARGMQAGSNHPIALAFQGVGASAPVSNVRNVPGQGIEAMLDEHNLRLGTAAFCGLPGADDASSVMHVMLADDRGALARFELEDSVRPEAAQLVAQLKARGLTVRLLSGDRAPVVQALATRVGIGQVRAQALPEDKLAYVEALQRSGRVVAMIGDGLNDAPVLAHADVSIAMAAGAEAAQRQADVVLLGDGLEPVEACFTLAGRAMRIIRQNFYWAIAYNALVLPLAAAGWIGPWEAALGMAMSSLLVTANSMRPLNRVPCSIPEETAWNPSTC